MDKLLQDSGFRHRGSAVEIPGAGLDDVLIELYKALLATDARNEGTRGSTKELLGVTLRIADPLARLSRSEDRGKPFSALGKLLWYLSGSDHLDFIEPYVPRYKDDTVDGILPGAYSPFCERRNDRSNQQRHSGFNRKLWIT
jgi:thymidylate synthase